MRDGLPGGIDDMFERRFGGRPAEEPDVLSASRISGCGTVRRLAVLGVALALVAAGCGGKSYSSKLNTICEDLTAKQASIGLPSSLTDLAVEGPQLLSAFDASIASIRALKPPAKLADAARRFVALKEQQRAQLAELVRLAGKNDTKAIAKLGARIEPLNRRANAIANGELRAPACGQNGGTS